MSRYLLDTHTAIWFFEGNAAISSTAERIIRNRANSIYLIEYDFCMGIDNKDQHR